MKNSEYIIKQYRGNKLVRTFTPTEDKMRPWIMNVNGKSYLRTNGWVLSKILPTLVDESPFTTRVFSDLTSKRYLLVQKHAPTLKKDLEL